MRSEKAAQASHAAVDGENILKARNKDGKRAVDLMAENEKLKGTAVYRWFYEAIS